MNRTRLKAYLLVLGVFVLGAVAGGAVSYAYAQRQNRVLWSGDRQAFEQRKVSALAEELELTAEQLTQVKAIFERHRSERESRMKTMFDTCGEPVRALRTQVDAEVSAVLTPDQAKRYAALKPPGR